MSGKRLTLQEQREILAEFPDAKSDGMTEKQIDELVQQLTAPVQHKTPRQLKQEERRLKREAKRKVKDMRRRIRRGELTEDDLEAIASDWISVGNDLRSVLGLKPYRRPKDE